MDVPSMIYADPALIDTIVGELKSQGTFDQFRKECINDVDTKPAYQNLHQRVESTVSNYLEGKTWRPDLNKNQLRDSLRKHILEMGFLETGVERIVDQVVNPKVHTVFMPQVEDVVYRVQGIPKPEKKTITNSSSTIGSASKNGGVFNQPPSFLPGLSFLPPALQNHIQKAPTLEDLLPTDLDPVSPESSKDSADEALEESGIIKQHDDSMESQLSGISDLTSHGSDHVAVESENKNDELNEDSHQSKMPCLNKMKSIETEEHFTERDASMSHDEAEQALEETQENLYPSGSVVQYGDQFSMEEEVATTVHNVNTEAPSDANVKNTNFFETGETLNPEKTELEGEENNIDSECAKYPHSCELSSAVVDDNSLAQSDDSQFSGSSDNKLLIDEMKDYNSQSGNSHQPEDERSSMKTSSEGFLSEENSKIMVVENIVEASEEARHGFEDSQDALEKPPLPQTPPVVRDHEDRPPLPPDSGPEVLQRPPLPLTPPLASQHEAILPPLPPPPPPPPSEAMKSTTPPPPKTPPLPQGFGCTGLEPMSTSSTSVIATHETERMNDRTFSPRSTTPTGKYPGIEHPSTPPGAPPVVNRSVECPPLPSTPPLANRPKEQDRPPLPPLPPPADILGVTERPPLPPMPPLAEKANLERPPTPQPTTLNRTPPPLPEEEFSRDSNASLSYEEGAVPKTPRWEPRSPETEKEKPALSDLEQIGIPNPTKMRQSCITSPKNSINCQDEDSQSGSEEMQLAWSPLSNHGDEGNDENGGKRPSEEKLSVEEAPLEDPSPQVKSKEDKGSSSERSRESKKDDELKSESEKHREKDNAKDGRSKERRKEDENDRSRKDSSSSSKRHDDRSSKHRESSSRSKHDDKSRSDKDRDRHSSHHRSDERRRDDRRDDKERSSSSRHKSSRSDDRHRHRDKDQRHGSSSRHEHHDKSSKSEDRSKSSKSHSSDRKDSDRKERESRDKERRMDKEKERSRKDSSRTDEKKRDKERDKDKRDKSSNICRPNNDRKSPDPDVNNGSTFGGNNHGATGSGGGDDHHHDTSNQDSNKGSGSTNTNSKSSDSSQQNNLCSDPPSTSSACNQACPLSSLPLKKRPLLPESEALHEFPCGQQLVLKIKKLKKCDDKPENTKRRKIKALRRLEKEAIRNLTKCPNSSHLVDSGDETSEPLDVSPTKYFESFWPTKSDDKAFLAYVEDLEQSKTLSGLSDLSGSDSEDEEILHSDDSKNPHSGVIGRDIIFSLSLLPDAQALKFPDPNCYDRRQDTKERASKSSNSVKATKRTKQRKPLDSESDTKRHKVLAKEVETPAPTELKSRRARKPNKRYSNDEFTSHFDNEDELDMIEEESVLVPGSSSPQPKESSTSITSASTTSWKDNEKIESVSLPEIDHQKEENKLNIDASRLCTVASKEKPHQSEQVTYSWNKDSYNSNSEDEMDSANTESDLIGTALKNLMMESGLGGPDEASGSQKVPSPPRKTLTNSLSGINTKTIPLSGVKRVGLSRNYKGNKKSSVKPSVAAVSCGQFSLPPSPESDVSASSYEKGAARKLQGSQSDAPELDSNAESNRTGTSRVKQHYSSDDLYKPRPPLRLTSKRSKAVSEQNGSH